MPKIQKQLTDEELIKIYHSSKYNFAEILKIIKKDFGIQLSKSTLLRYVKLKNIENRQQKGIRKIRLGGNNDQ
jgi:hypothetical protein